MKSGDVQYKEGGDRILREGVWVYNARTGKKCLTIPNLTFTYDKLPLITTKQVFYKTAINELLGYIKGFTSAEDFRKIKCGTWNSNANKTKAWLDNPLRKGEDDMGKVYGAIAKDFGGIDLIHKVYNNLKNGIDDRGEIITFWKPDDFDKGCLRPCMFQHHFTILDGHLYLTSYQRSCDYPLGSGFNMIQVWFFLELMARITGLEVGHATHHMVNVHVYEDQLEIFKEQMSRVPISDIPELVISPVVKTLQDVEDWMTGDDIWLDSAYEHCGKLSYPFSE